MSKVIANKTLEECAYYAKQRINLSVDNLIIWLKQKETINRLKIIDKSNKWYKELIKRVLTYNNW